jgi:hypothetical protein
MGKNVRRHSTVTTELPREIRAEVDRLLLEPGVTYDDITEFIKGRGHDISRSAVGRYGKEFMAAYQRLRQVEDQARSLVSEAGEGLVLEEAASKLFAQQILEALVDNKMVVTDKAKLIDAFAKLQASSTMREKFKSEIANRASSAAEKVEKIARKGGLTIETVQAIRREILGIVK